MRLKFTLAVLSLLFCIGYVVAEPTNSARLNANSHHGMQHKHFVKNHHKKRVTHKHHRTCYKNPWGVHCTP